MIKVSGMLLAILAFAFATHSGAQSDAIAVSEVIPFSEGSSGEVGLVSPSGLARTQIEETCDLGRLLSRSVVDAARRKGILVVQSSEPEKIEGRILVMEIEGARGQIGGALSGTKSLTVRGELREGDTVIGSFVARRQQTALTKGTCRSLSNCVRKISKDIARWLKRPVPKARLGSA
jgi:hypothetical protein